MENIRFSLIDCHDIFLLDRRSQNLSPKSISTYRRRIGEFIAWCDARGIHYVDELTTNHIRSYQVMQVETVADISAKNRMVDIKTFLKFCVEEGFISESPAARVKLPRVVERIPTVLTAEQIGRVYECCETDRDRALILVLLDTGARLAEMQNMDVSDVDITEGSILIRAGKPRRDRRCYISAQTQKQLLRYMRGNNIVNGPLWRIERSDNGLSEGGIREVIRRLRDKSGVVGCSPHNFRKTFVTSLLRAGVDVFTLKELSGHKSLEALRPYIRIANIDAQHAHQRHSPVENFLGKKRR